MFQILLKNLKCVLLESVFSTCSKPYMQISNSQFLDVCEFVCTYVHVRACVCVCMSLPGGRSLNVALPPVLPGLILTLASAAHAERSAVVPGISSAIHRTAKLADSPFAIIAVGNGHVQGSRFNVCVCVCVCLCVCACKGRLVGMAHKAKISWCGKDKQLAMDYKCAHGDSLDLG